MLQKVSGFNSNKKLLSIIWLEQLITGNWNDKDEDVKRKNMIGRAVANGGVPIVEGKLLEENDTV